MKSSHADYRRYERTGVTLPVTVSHSQHVLPLQLRTLNISSGGLGLVREMGLQMRQGDPVTLRFRGMDDQPLAAHVVHVGPHHVGLSLLKHALSDMELDQLINLAPWLQRQKVRAKRALWTQSRRFAVLSVNTLLRPLLLQQIKPKVLFAVYGSERDVRTYYTPTLQKLLPPMIIAGFIRAGRHRGLMVASQHLESELAKSNDKVEDYLLKLRKEFPKVRRIALVGRLPTFVRKAGLDITAPFVDGSMGTRYMIWDVARQMRALPGYQNDIGIIVLGGAGRIGDPVCRDLLREFPRVVAFDPRYTEEQEEVFTR
ncbi:MAG: PilZ domain-containing protein, partial [Gammaproteobacteria bacterium]|nr:PilZ domain-containing protein [Gammaproteobacteria bacterium]